LIKDLLRRFSGVTEYEKGIEEYILGRIVSNGAGNAFSFFPMDALAEGVPILVTNTKRKFTIPYESEEPFAFQIRYTNQDDEEKVAKSYIPVYACEGLDFRVVMPAVNEFVKEIVAIEPRVDEFEFTPDNVVSGDELGEITGEDLSEFGWTTDYYSNTVLSEEDNALKITVDVAGASSSFEYSLFASLGEFDQTKLADLPDFGRQVKIHAPIFIDTIDKFIGFDVRFKIPTSYQSLHFTYAKGGKTYVKLYSPNATLVSSWQSSFGTEAAELVTANVWTVKSLTIADMYEQDDPTTNEIGFFIAAHGVFQAPDDTYDWHIDYINVDNPRGNEFDECEVFGAKGNISRLMSAFALQFSDAVYQKCISGLQRYTQSAFKGGLRYLSRDYGIYLSVEYETEVLRILTKLFSAFIVPAQSVMQESMSAIYAALDPLGSVEVSAEYSDSFYKMVVDIFSGDLEFTEADIEVMLVFAERYRPVPAELEVNVNFQEGVEEQISVGESAELEVTTGAPLMSPSTLMSPSLLMGAGTIATITLPADYP